MMAFPGLCGWLVHTDKVITAAIAQENKTAVKQEDWKSTFYSCSFLLGQQLIHFLLTAFGIQLSAGASCSKSLRVMDCLSDLAQMLAPKEEQR